MENEAIQKLVKEYPRARCLWCRNLVYFSPVNKHHCTKNLQPPCGRKFDPKQGGDPVPVC